MMQLCRSTLQHAELKEQRLGASLVRVVTSTFRINLAYHSYSTWQSFSRSSQILTHIRVSNSFDDFKYNRSSDGHYGYGRLNAL